MSNNSINTYLNYLKKSGVSIFLQESPKIYYDAKIITKDQLNKNDISEIDNLNELELLIKKTNNHLTKKNPKIIIGEGNINAKIMLIGGFVEERINQELKSISGQSEKLLNNMLKAINLNRDQIYTTNIIPWTIDKNKKIENKDILVCLPFIQRQIELIQPELILLLGEIAANSILNTNLEINKLRGKWYDYKSINLDKYIKCFITYHPNELINYPKFKKSAWEDLQIFQKKL